MKKVTEFSVPCFTLFPFECILVFFLSKLGTTNASRPLSLYFISLTSPRLLLLLLMRSRDDDYSSINSENGDRVNDANIDGDSRRYVVQQLIRLPPPPHSLSLSLTHAHAVSLF